MEAIETIEKDGWTVRVYQDVDAMSPDDWDNLATFSHTTDYSFGESLGRRSYDDRRDGAYVRALAIFGDDVAGVLPVRIDEHGPQVSVYETSPDNANGVLYTTHKRVTELCGDQPEYHARGWVEEALRGELAVWRQYLEGDVWGYSVEGPSGEQGDSLWGMYGLDYATKEAGEALDDAIVEEAKTAAAVTQIMAL
jgi:hypothetical protein